MVRGKIHNQEPIVKPGYGWSRLDPGLMSVLVSSRDDQRLIRERLQFSENRYHRFFNSRLYINQQSPPLFSLVGPLIGAPYAVMLLETLISRGVKKFFYLGWCGAVSRQIKIGDIIIPTGCLIDEGTSRHYQREPTDHVAPSMTVVQELTSTAKRLQSDFKQGLIWTTDGVFRETPEKVMAYQQRGVLSVEMELSALLSAGRFHGIAIGGILVVSDEISSLNWKPGFKTDRFKNGRRAAIEIICEICRNQ